MEKEQKDVASFSSRNFKLFIKINDARDDINSVLLDDIDPALVLLALRMTNGDFRREERKNKVQNSDVENKMNAVGLLSSSATQH